LLVTLFHKHSNNALLQVATWFVLTFLPGKPLVTNFMKSSDLTTENACISPTTKFVTRLLTVLCDTDTPLNAEAAAENLGHFYLLSS